jgi:hypothetical protein
MEGAEHWEIVGTIGERFSKREVCGRHETTPSPDVPLGASRPGIAGLEPKKKD